MYIVHISVPSVYCTLFSSKLSIQAHTVHRWLEEPFSGNTGYIKLFQVHVVLYRAAVPSPVGHHHHCVLEDIPLHQGYPSIILNHPVLEDILLHQGHPNILLNHRVLEDIPLHQGYPSIILNHCVLEDILLHQGYPNIPLKSLCMYIHFSFLLTITI